IFSSSLTEGSMRTPALVSVTVERKNFIENLLKLKHTTRVKFSGVLAVPGISEGKKLVYFFNINKEQDMEILAVFNVFLDENEEMDSISGVFPTSVFFERELEAYGIRFRVPEEIWGKSEPEKAKIEIYSEKITG
ncbi:MAG: NADH-quinone oxidoreductase subunit C, partial [Candidatus Odinarchaeota archaeon]